MWCATAERAFRAERPASAVAPNVTRQSPVFGEASYKLTPATNAGQAKSYGSELELAIRLTPRRAGGASRPLGSLEYEVDGPPS